MAFSQTAPITITLWPGHSTHFQSSMLSAHPAHTSTVPLPPIQEADDFITEAHQIGQAQLSVGESMRTTDDSFSFMCLEVVSRWAVLSSLKRLRWGWLACRSPGSFSYPSWGENCHLHSFSLQALLSVVTIEQRLQRVLLQSDLHTPLHFWAPCIRAQISYSM